MEEENCPEDMRSTTHAGSKPFNEEPMKLQPKIHDEKNLLTCPDCPEIFEYSEFLKVHRTIHEPIDEKKKRKCPLCRSRFNIMSHYAEHIQSHFTSPYRCNFCPKRILSYTHFKNHTVAHKKNKDLVCRYCGKSFSVKRSLDIHVRIHTNERPYKCDDCGNSFIQLSSFNTHKKLVHKLGKLLDCPKCSNQFSTGSSLKRHIKRIHDSGKLSTCIECKKEFETKELLEKHRIDDHSGLSAFYEVCLVCKKEFFTRAQYVEHHHGNGDYPKEGNSKVSEDDDKPMTENYEQLASEQENTCRWCKVNFVTKKALNYHENLHKYNKHQCKECNITFPRLAIYLTHIRNKKCIKWSLEALIPELKQLKCIICEKIFGNHTSITRHMLALHMRDLYPCKFCGSTVTLQSLRYHLIGYHNGESKYSCVGCDASFVTLKAYIEHRNIYKLNLFSHKDAVESASITTDSDMTNDAPVKAEEYDIVDTVDSDMTEEDNIVDIPDTVMKKEN